MGRLHRSSLVVPAVRAEHKGTAVVQAVEVLPVQIEPAVHSLSAELAHR